MLLAAGLTQAQDITSPVSMARKPFGMDAISTYRMGKQSVSLDGINKALLQTGYAAMPNQFTIFGAQSEFTSTRNRKIAMVTQFDLAVGPQSQLVTSNGTNTARAFFFQYGIGAGYRIVNSERFSITPKLMFSPAFFNLTVTKNNAAQPSLTAILTNPSSQERTSIGTGTINADLGLMGQYRFAYKATTKQTDCGTQTTERSLVLGFDAGYRLGTTNRFGRNAGAGDGNPTVNLSGWYATIRLGFGRRTTVGQ